MYYRVVSLCMEVSSNGPASSFTILQCYVPGKLKATIGNLVYHFNTQINAHSQCASNFYRWYLGISNNFLRGGCDLHVPGKWTFPLMWIFQREWPNTLTLYRFILASSSWILTISWLISSWSSSTSIPLFYKSEQIQTISI